MELDMQTLLSERGRYRSYLMFTLERSRDCVALTQLADFDELVEVINTKVRPGEKFTIGLVDWIEESEWHGVLELQKQSETELTFIEAQDVDEDYVDYPQQIKTSLQRFFTVSDQKKEE